MRFVGVLLLALGISIAVYMGFKGLQPTQMVARLLALFKLPNPYAFAVEQTAPGANLPGGIPLGDIADVQGPQQPAASSATPPPSVTSSPSSGGLAVGLTA